MCSVYDNTAMGNDGKEKPPDDNIMDIGISPAPGMLQVGLLSPFHATKRQRISSSSSYTVDTGNDETDDINVLPTVDHSAYCSGCESVVKDIALSIVCCSSCTKRFHANCPSLAVLSKRAKVMPSQTNIKYFNQICKNNTVYMGGVFSWTCASCEQLKNTSHNDLLGDRMNLIESRIVQSAGERPLKDLLCQTLQEVNQLKKSLSSPAHPLVQPSAVNIKTSPSADNVVSLADIMKEQQQSDLNNQSGQKPPRAIPKSLSSNFKVSLKCKDADASVRRVLGKYASEGVLSNDYQYKTRGKDTIELLFKSHESASVEYDKLKTALDEIEVAEPKMARARRAYLVGLEDYHTADFVMSEIKRKYGDLFQLESANKSCLDVIEFGPCNKNQSVYRATLELSEELLRIIKEKLGNRLRIGFLGCTVYPFKAHDRCSKCQSHEHKKKDCKRDSPLCANCGGNHYTYQCTSDEILCCNCAAHEQYKSGAHTHKASSPECPVLKDFQKKRSSKN